MSETVEKKSRAKKPSAADTSSPAAKAELVTPTVEQRAVVALSSSKTEADLIALVGKSKDIVAVLDKDGRAQCHRMAMDLQAARTTITKIAKEAREDATKFSKAVIAEEARLIAITKAEEDRIFALRDKFDEQVRLEQERLEKIERERVQVIMDRIAAIRNVPFSYIGKPAGVIEQAINELVALEVGDDFGEPIYHVQANTARESSLVALRAAHQSALAQEESARQLAAQAEENRIAAEKLRVENERLAREKQELEDQRRAAELKAEHEAAETKKQQKEAAERIAEQQAALDLRIQKQNEADDQRRKVAEQEAADKAERERIDSLPPVELLEKQIEADPPKEEQEPVRVEVSSSPEPAQASFLPEADKNSTLAEAARVNFIAAAHKALDLLSAEEVIFMLSDVIDGRLSSEENQRQG